MEAIPGARRAHLLGWLCFYFNHRWYEFYLFVSYLEC